MNWVKFTKIDIAGIQYSPKERRLSLLDNSQYVILSEQNNKILTLLCLNPDNLVNRDELINYVWGDQYITGDKGLNHAIWKIRQSLQSLDNSFVDKLIRIPKKGYQLNVMITFIWIYNESPLKSSVISKDNQLYIKGESIPLSNIDKLLLHAISQSGNLFPFRKLIELTQLDKKKLYNAIGQLQYCIHKYCPNTVFILEWNNAFIKTQS